MGSNDFTNIGEQIREAVEDAIDSMDFKQLNHAISDTVASALDEARRQLAGVGQDYKNTCGDARYRERGTSNPTRNAAPNTAQDAAPNASQSAAQDATQNTAQGSARSTAQKKPYPRYSQHTIPRHQQSQAPWQQAPDFRWQQAQNSRKPQVQKQPQSNIRVNPPSRVKGILYTVFGSIGLGISVIGLLIVLIVALILEPVWSAWGLIIFFMAATGISAGLLGYGSFIRRKLKRLNLYLKEAGEKTYCSIHDLVGRTGKQENYILKDLKKMIRSGILPHAHIDEKNTCLMLDDKSYQQYLQAMSSMEQRKKEEQAAQNEKSRQDSDRMSQVTAEGRGYLKALRDANEAIAGEVISAKLSRLETVIDKIFHVVDKHPKQLDEIQKFMEYYLPTTVKLVNAYRDFDNVGIPGENISMAKSEIEQTLDTINQAFERLLDDLYQDEAFDVSTDASVLQTMLKKDGFVNSDFSRREDS